MFGTGRHSLGAPNQAKRAPNQATRASSQAKKPTVNFAERKGVGINLHTSILQTPRVSEDSPQHFTVPAIFFVSSPKPAACHRRCTVAHDVFSRSRVETEPATVHPVHSEFLLWSSSLVWLEQDLLTERAIC